MNDEDDVVNYLIWENVVNSHKGLGEKFEETTIVQKNLRSLPLHFDAKVSAIEELKDVDNLKKDEIYEFLLHMK